ncbi:MAG: putative transcriptional regulator [Saprospiraceae bacterium]|jgi:putative transcriptional regulator
MYTDIEYLDIIGERVKAQRLKRNISQQELADFCGVSRRTIMLLEKGKGINILAFIRILRKLDLDMNLLDLIPEVSDNNPFEKKNKRQRAS